MPSLDRRALAVGMHQSPTASAAGNAVGIRSWECRGKLRPAGTDEAGRVLYDVLYDLADALRQAKRAE